MSFCNKKDLQSSRSSSDLRHVPERAVGLQAHCFGCSKGIVYSGPFLPSAQIQFSPSRGRCVDRPLSCSCSCSCSSSFAVVSFRQADIEAQVDLFHRMAAACKKKVRLQRLLFIHPCILMPPHSFFSPPRAVRGAVYRRRAECW